MPEPCPWALSAPESLVYHDTEWGVPKADDATQFEFLLLESAQAGLSWLTILRKREGYRRCFAGFDAKTVAAFTPADEERVLQDAGIVRNRLKVRSAVTNARLFLELAAKHGSFSRWLWGFVDGKPVVNTWTRQEDIPATSPISDAVSKEMKRMGFKFMGSTIVYAHMQASGLINDHLVSCPRHQAVQALPVLFD